MDSLRRRGDFASRLSGLIDVVDCRPTSLERSSTNYEHSSISRITLLSIEKIAKEVAQLIHSFVCPPAISRKSVSSVEQLKPPQPTTRFLKVTGFKSIRDRYARLAGNIGFVAGPGRMPRTCPTTLSRDRIATGGWSNSRVAAD
jgi:hypothetical protein